MKNLEKPLHVVVCGGGIAGLSAATILAERGAKVTVIEKATYLGGRAGAWTDKLADGTPFEMERGFHAFFRQYYNLRALIRRVDPKLTSLLPLEDYPLLGPKGASESFRGLPKQTPANLIALVRRTKTLSLMDLSRVNVRQATAMLQYEAEDTYKNYDHLTAAEYLRSLRFPPAAKQLLFDVFAHSFFNPEETMSAAELLMMFHFYFTGNPEGLVFDVLKKPFSTGLFVPLQRYLEARDVTFELGAGVTSVTQKTDKTFTVALEGGRALDADGVVLALNVPGVKQVVASSTGLGDTTWREKVASLETTAPFVVWRLWLDKPVAKERSAFAGTTGLGPIDNISLYHLFEDESRAWQERTGGAVVELHAYAVEPGFEEAQMRASLLGALHELYPETRDANIVEERWLVREDCPAFAVGSSAKRPGVVTPIEGLALAGDFVKLPWPSALMERAAMSGFAAANYFLERADVEPELILSIPKRGIAKLPRWITNPLSDRPSV